MELETCNKPIEHAATANVMAAIRWCLLAKNHSETVKCVGVLMGPVTAHREDCEDPSGACQGCWDGETVI